MSAAATAAGYLYASGRLRGRAQREQEGHPEQEKEKPKPAGRPIRVDRPRREVRVAALPPVEEPQQKPRRTPTIQYRTRRWKPEEAGGE